MENRLVAGVDEVGRGAIAGPVVAAACVLDVPLRLKKRGQKRFWHVVHAKDILIADSKVLSPKQRQKTYAWLRAHATFAVGVVSVQIINQHGILRATERAMQKAIGALQNKTTLQHLFIDGRDKFTFPVPHTSVVRGDNTHACIAAASIIAKVTRDERMEKLPRTYAAYDFAQHKGYGTAKHKAAVLHLGITALHRTVFVTSWLSGTSAKSAKTTTKRQVRAVARSAIGRA
jgi:ribonuclease HII